MSTSRAFPPNAYDKELYSAHTEALFKGLLVHLDDPSSQIQVSSLHNAPYTITTFCLGGSVYSSQNSILAQQTAASGTGRECEAQASNRKVRWKEPRRPYTDVLNSSLDTAMTCWHCKVM